MKRKRMGQEAMDSDKRKAFMTFSFFAAVAIFIIFYHRDIKNIWEVIRYNLSLW